MRSIRLPLLYVSTVFALVACGGGGGGTSSTVQAGATLAGVVLDGYLSNAKVFVDLNANGTFDSGEPYTYSSADGSWSFPAGTNIGANPRIVAEAVAGVTIDSDSPNAPISSGYVMFAPPGEPSVVSPLTTLVASKMINSGISLSDAEASVRQDLGIPSNAPSLLLDYAKPSLGSVAGISTLRNHAPLIASALQAAQTAGHRGYDVASQAITTYVTQLDTGNIPKATINTDTPLTSNETQNAQQAINPPTNSSNNQSQGSSAPITAVFDTAKFDNSTFGQ